MKVCGRCKVEKPLDEFHRNRSKADGRQTRCKECNTVASSTAYHADPDYFRCKLYRRKYGISLADFNRMVAEQGGRCAICATDAPGGKGNRLHVDHDHATGEVRGLLCTNCNRALGYFKDDGALLLKATAYLQDHAPQRVGLEAPATAGRK